MRCSISVAVASLLLFLMLPFGGLVAVSAHSGTRSHAPNYIVKIINLRGGSYAYRPKLLKVKVGSTITWQNRSNTDHTVTTGNARFGISFISSGHKAKLTFRRPGTYNYHCSFHPWMKGRIVVHR